jgi:hypothetical protein
MLDMREIIQARLEEFRQRPAAANSSGHCWLFLLRAEQTERRNLHSGLTNALLAVFAGAVHVPGAGRPVGQVVGRWGGGAPMVAPSPEHLFEAHS